MIRAVIPLIFLLGVLPPASASSGNHGATCIAKVLKSEVTAYAPMGYWLGRVTYEMVPPGGSVVGRHRAGYDAVAGRPSSRR
jgi:hypothetical protein